MNKNTLLTPEQVSATLAAKVVTAATAIGKGMKAGTGNTPTLAALIADARTLICELLQEQLDVTESLGIARDMLAETLENPSYHTKVKDRAVAIVEVIKRNVVLHYDIKQRLDRATMELRDLRTMYDAQEPRTRSQETKEKTNEL